MDTALAPKTVSQSRCEKSEIVLPNDTNGLGNLMGGRLLYLMDVCAAISAQRHANRVCVTASVDSVEFHSPIRQGEIVVLESVVNRAFKTSMEVEINVWAENPLLQTRRYCNRAYYTFVAVDEAGKPVSVPRIVAETKAEQQRYAGAAERREVRLVLAGRMKVEEAANLRQDVAASLHTNV